MVKKNISINLKLSEKDQIKINNLLRDNKILINNHSCHLTLINLGECESSHKKYIRKILRNYMKVQIKLEFEKLDIYGKNNDRLVLKIKKSDKLQNIYDTITTILDITKEMEYNPHITLGKIDKEIDYKDIELRSNNIDIECLEIKN
jgi:2'-5' RNA ligase